MTGESAWIGTPLPAVALPDGIDAEAAAEARLRLERVGYTEFRLVDRGHFDEIVNVDLPDVLAELTSTAREITGRVLEPTSARAVRLGPGDYVLLRHDRVHEGRPVEAILDLSAAPVPRAEVHYRHRGQLFFSVPSSPRTLALIERGPTVMCNHTYVSKLHPSASVVRLIVLLRD
jgi:hypothetical protein